MSWTEERVELLKKLWAEGFSASQIAAQLGGVTRNAVIGKVHGLSLPGRSKPASTKPKRQITPREPTVSANKLKAARLKNEARIAKRVLARVPFKPRAITDLSAPTNQRVSLLALTEGMCKWPFGDPMWADFAFCGHKNFNSLPYCEYHSRISYDPVEKRYDQGMRPHYR
jgi:GcrA cell cycle regulator